MTTGIPVATPRSRLWLEWAMLAVTLSTAIVFAGAQSWFQRLDAAIYDFALRQWERRPSTGIVIVGIDEQSLEQLGRWPWRRSVHATLLPHVADARAVLLDFILAEEGAQDPVGEEALAAAIARHGRVILPVHVSSRPDGTSAMVMPAAPLRRGAAALGHIQLDADIDGVVRRIHLQEGPPGAVWPHAAVALLDIGRTSPRAGEPPSTRSASVTSRAEPAARSQGEETLIAYAGGAGSFTYVSYLSVLRGDVPDAYFRDKFVLVGATAAGMGDFHSTPTARHGGLMPGVEIIANVLQQRGEDLELRVAAPRDVLWATLGIVALVLFASVFLSAGARLLLTCVLVIALPWGSALVLCTWHVWWPPATAVMALLASFPLWSWRRLAAAEAFVDAELVQLDKVLGRNTAATLRGGDPLDARIGAIRGANDEIRKRALEREETISFLTHDLRSPQVSILALANLYRGGREGAVDGAFWERLTGYANQTLSLADDFVQLARAEHMRPEILRPVNLGETLADAVDDAWAAAQAKGMTLDSDLPPDAWALGDRVLLTRAFRNLLDNAVKHGPAGSTISVAVARADGTWHCSVADAGAGVAVQERERVFDRYHITSGTHARKAGTGLGLALVKAVAERCGGRAFVDESPSGGARFTVALPAHEATE